MRTPFEKLSADLREAKRLFGSYKIASAYQRVERKDLDVIVYTKAVEEAINIIETELSAGRYEQARVDVENLLDNLYEECRKLPLPFLSA